MLSEALCLTEKRICLPEYHAFDESMTLDVVSVGVFCDRPG